MIKNKNSGQKNQRVMWQFVAMPIVFAVIFLITGLTGITINQHSSASLAKLTDSALGPTIAFEQITAQLNLLQVELLRMDSAELSPAEQQAVLSNAKILLLKTDKKIKTQVEIQNGRVFTSYFLTWIKDWENFRDNLTLSITSFKLIQPHLHEADKQITTLIERIENINAFIQSDVQDILEQSTAFSTKASFVLKLALILGAILGILSSFLIIRSLRRLLSIISDGELQLIQTSKLASLGEMSASIAHEINNPLGIISGSINLLPKFTNNPEKFLAKIEAAQKAIDRISKIVLGLRKFSRTSDQQTRSCHDLATIVKESMDLTEAKSKKFSTSVTCQIQEKLFIYCDELEIEQVLINLINNGIDAIKERSEKWVKVEIFEEQQNVVLRVTDSGPGISKEIQQKIFNPFFTTKKVGEGTGLGLSITKGILDEHQATIGVLASVPNTCFEIRFPKAVAPVVTIQQAA